MQMPGWVVISITGVVLVGITGLLIWSLVHHILQERRTHDVRKLWSNFGLSIAFCSLFLISWIAQALVEWETYGAQQREHGAAVTFKGFLMEFGQSTLENWQSEFLQLFSFVVLAALLIHRNSAESKDSDERIEAKIDGISRRLDELETSRAGH